MAKMKSMAAAFNCSVNELCKQMGYSRRGVHYNFDTPSLYKKKKLLAAIEALTGESNRLYDEDISKAEAERERLIGESHRLYDEDIAKAETKRQEREVFIAELRKKVV